MFGVLALVFAGCMPVEVEEDDVTAEEDDVVVEDEVVVEEEPAEEEVTE